MSLIQIPESQNAAKVSVIDNGARIKGSLSFFVEPPLIDHIEGAAPAFSFLIENENNRRLIFDLGIRKCYDDYTPFVKEYHRSFKFDPGEEIFDLLDAQGIALDTIEGVIWSHHHIDHIGNPRGFHPNTDLIVGPGFKEHMLPGYPTNPGGFFHESDISGRNLREIDFESESNGLVIGGFRAIDYFNDGSFYLLETPGHTVDHISGLARTNVSPPKFILMGADVGHHAAQWRPSRLAPLPKEISPSPFGSDHQFNLRLNICPGEIFEHARLATASSEPFLRIKAGHPHDVDTARDSLKKVEAFDADENILVIVAHDYTLLPVLEFFPKSANEWHHANWKEQGRWEFLRDLRDAVEDSANLKPKGHENK